MHDSVRLVLARRSKWMRQSRLPSGHRGRENHRRTNGVVSVPQIPLPNSIVDCRSPPRVLSDLEYGCGCLYPFDEVLYTAELTLCGTCVQLFSISAINPPIRTLGKKTCSLRFLGGGGSVIPVSSLFYLTHSLVSLKLTEYHPPLLTLPPSLLQIACSSALINAA